MPRSTDIVSRVFRNLERNGISINDVLDEEIYDQIIAGQDRIISEVFSDKIIKIQFVEDQDTYPLTTDEGDDIERKNIASVKVIKLPTGWTASESISDFGNEGFFPSAFSVIGNNRFVEFVNAHPDQTGRPRIATIINSELKVYPIPGEDEDGEEIELYTYLSSSAGIIDATNEPELPNHYDKALEQYATAQFLDIDKEAGWIAKYTAEITRLRPIINRKHHTLSRPSIPGW